MYGDLSTTKLKFTGGKRISTPHVPLGRKPLKPLWVDLARVDRYYVGFFYIISGPWAGPTVETICNCMLCLGDGLGLSILELRACLTIILPSPQARHWTVVMGRSLVAKDSRSLCNPGLQGRIIWSHTFMSLSAESTTLTVRKWSVQRRGIKAKGEGFHGPTSPYASYGIVRDGGFILLRRWDPEQGVLVYWAVTLVQNSGSHYIPQDPCLLVLATGLSPPTCSFLPCSSPLPIPIPLAPLPSPPLISSISLSLLSYSRG